MARGYNPYENNPHADSLRNQRQETSILNTRSEEIPTEYVNAAENAIKGLLDEKYISASKIRKLFGLYTDLYNEARHATEAELSIGQQHSLAAARVRTVYEYGRNEQGVRIFIERSKLLDYLKGIGKSREKFLRFYDYFEALVAYHKYYESDAKERRRNRP